MSSLLKVVQSLPTTPGIYIYKNDKNEIIYVGKAINLKKRVSQYFQRDDALGPKTNTLVSQISKIEYRQVDSEIEALVLEASYIKKFKPKYNSLLKDDRSYLYICITKEEFPRIYSAHKSKLAPNCHVYGPFPNGSAVKSLLKIIRKIIPFYGLKKHSKTACLYCHLNLCPGPNPDRGIYRSNIGKIKKVLSGNFSSLSKQLKKEMKQASKNEDYETALTARKQLEALDYVVTGWSQVSNLYEKINLPEDDSSSALHELELTLKPYFQNIKKILRIECFDISNLGSEFFVGSMSVSDNGRLNKQQYRKFKIKTKETPDDQFMIKEVVWRRLNHPEWDIPDLIVVDGGKPQVSAALEAARLQDRKDIAIIGLAKKYETLVINHLDNWIEINLPLRSHALRLLQCLRDEAHRFANSYRKKLMNKSTFK